MTTKGVVYHVLVSAVQGTKLTGGAISTSSQLEPANLYARKTSGFVYKIDLSPKQGIDAGKTCKAIIASDTVHDENELRQLTIARYTSNMLEKEISVISSISPSQISVNDIETDEFIPIEEWVRFHRDN